MLNKDFMPAYVWVKEFMKEADEPFTIAVERENGIVENYETKINTNDTEKSKFYIERTVKTLLWFYGGFKIYLSGQNEICEYIKQCYSKGGIREFDMDFMADVYGEKFEVIICDKVPNTTEGKSRICIENDGNVVGLDVGASFIKVCAMSDGENVYSDRIPWQPTNEEDISYHTEKIKSAIDNAVQKLGKADRIGVSSAGVQIDNTTRVASLFRNVKDKDKVKNFYKNAAGDIQLTVVNDGDAAAVYGLIQTGKRGIFGISIGSSEAGGYVDKNGTVSGRLNEPEFVPVDFSENSPVSEWSGDKGCGVNYLSQKAVVRLAPLAGIALSENETPSQKCYQVQKLVEKNALPAIKVYETIGEYLGYALLYYSLFYEFDYIMLTGGVVSGAEREIVIDNAKKVWSKEKPNEKLNFLEIADNEQSYLNQAVAAASLKRNN